MAISYNWLFQWDYTFYKWGDLLVLITGITRAITVMTIPQYVWYIYANIWGILMVNITIYRIHGSYG